MMKGDSSSKVDWTFKNTRIRFDDLCNHCSDLIFVADKELNLLFVNQSWKRTLEYSEGELIGRTLGEFMSPDAYKALSGNLSALSSGTPGEPVEIDLKAKDGRKVTLEGTLGIWTWEEKKKKWIRGIFRDISDRQRSEREALKKKKLEALGTLSGGIAHDYNNILTAILGNLSLALMKLNRADDLYPLIEDAEKATQGAAKLTAQLLTFAKGGWPIKSETTPGKLIKESVEFGLRGSNVACSFHISNELWKINIDEGQIGQVITNLVINAVQAMHHGGNIRVIGENIHLKNDLVVHLKAGNYIKITIIDQGAGIPDKDISKIFDPYFSTKKAGVGLGLASAYSIIQKHEGYIAVDTEVGRGSSFSVFLPATTGKESQKDQVRSDLSLHRLKILLMDDEELIRKVAKRVLTDLGCQITMVADGAQALAEYRQNLESGKPFDIVILDLTIPGGMGGEEAIEEILKLNPNVRGIVSSGYSNDPVMANYGAYGFKAVITKPFTQKSLLQAIQQAMSGSLDDDVSRSSPEEARPSTFSL
ncbi:ATP-binding protein [Acidobacteriota bacterium]